MARKSQQELMDIAWMALPSGDKDLTYLDFATALTVAGERDAITYYRELKKRGLAGSNLVVNDDGELVHYVYRIEAE